MSDSPLSVQAGETEARHSCEPEGLAKPPPGLRGCARDAAAPATFPPTSPFRAQLRSGAASPRGCLDPPSPGGCSPGETPRGFLAEGSGVTPAGAGGSDARSPGRQQPVALKGSQEPLITYSNSVHHFFALRKRRAGSKSSASAAAPSARPGKAGFLRALGGLRAWAERGVRPRGVLPWGAWGVSLGPPGFASPALAADATPRAVGLPWRGPILHPSPLARWSVHPAVTPGRAPGCKCGRDEARGGSAPEPGGRRGSEWRAGLRALSGTATSQGAARSA